MNIQDALRQAAEKRGGLGSVADLVGKLGGTKAAAADLGVTQRTVQRWVKAEREGATRNARPAPATKAVRLRVAAQKGMRRNGVQIKGKVEAGPGRRYLNKRDLSKANSGTGITLTPDQTAAILDQLNAGNDEAAEELLNEYVGENYMSGGEWEFGEVTTFSLDEL